MTKPNEKTVRNRRLRLRQWLNLHYEGAQAPFIERTGINQGELSGLLNKKSFGENKARSLELLAGMPEFWLDSVSEEEIPPHPPPIFIPIRFVNFRLKAGITGFAVDYLDDDEEPLHFNKTWLQQKHYDPDSLVLCRVYGDSMEPRLYAKDTVLINTDDTDPQDGEVFAINYEGEPLVKRMVRNAGRWWISSDNPDKARHPDKLCEGDYCLIIGKVVLIQSTQI